jgi:hypothetical protein
MAWKKINDKNQIAQLKIGDVLLHYNKLVIQIPDELNTENIGDLFLIESFTERDISIRSFSKNSADIQGAFNSVYSTRVTIEDLISTGKWFIKMI